MSATLTTKIIVLWYMKPRKMYVHTQVSEKLVASLFRVLSYYC